MMTIFQCWYRFFYTLYIYHCSHIIIKYIDWDAYTYYEIVKYVQQKWEEV